jgi:hypothetical protein
MIDRYLVLAALDRTGNPLNYLAVIAFTNSTSEGDAALLQLVGRHHPHKLWLIILLLLRLKLQNSKPRKPVPFVPLFVGLPDCNTAAFSNFANPAAILAPSDGFPRT